jgi:hypothetical protein
MLKRLDPGCPVQGVGGSATVAVTMHVDCIVPSQCQHRIQKGIHQATAQRSVVGDGDGSDDRLDAGDGPRSEEAVGVDVQAPTNVGEAGEGQRSKRWVDADADADVREAVEGKRRERWVLGDKKVATVGSTIWSAIPGRPPTSMTRRRAWPRPVNCVVRWWRSRPVSWRFVRASEPPLT